MKINLCSKINYIHNKKNFHRYHKKFFVRWNIIYIKNLTYHWNKNFMRLRLFRIKKIIIGINKCNKTQSNFFFLEFYNFKKTKSAYELLTGYKFNRTIFKIDFEKNLFTKKQFKKSFSQNQS
mmetsp:Transcript_37052/g.98560  ORF Transcript_37052/g.98560 Transcript_37052/m.98560 type:complete len:122 (+) Transcript_37052:19679-20044(+)